MSRRTTLVRVLDPSSESIRKVTAMRLMAVPVEPALKPVRGGFLPALGTMRRLRALIAIGYQKKELADALGMSLANLSRILTGERSYVSPETEVKVKELFDVWQMHPKNNRRSILKAERRGWAPPFAWDEESIDDPKSRPCMPLGFTTAGRMNQYKKHKAKGLADSEIARRLDINPSTLSHWLKKEAA